MASGGKGLAKMIGAQVAPRLGKAAPQLTTTFVREALHRAIDGVGPFPGAAATADRALADADGDEAKAVTALIEAHVRIAGGQGFLTNLGGVITAPIAIPANLTGLAIVQCRLIASIAHLRGHDLGYARVRIAVMATMMGEERVEELLTAMRLPSPPMAIATSPAIPTGLETQIATTVASDLISSMAGKRMVSVIGRRIPVVGGVWGAGADGYLTWKLGRYAEREFLRRTTR